MFWRTVKQIAIEGLSFFGLVLLVGLVVMFWLICFRSMGR